MPTPTSRPVGYLELLRTNRRFRLLWSGEVVSLLGDWFATIASATLVADLTGSGLAVGGLFVARMLPPFLVSPVAGVAADRFDRRRLLILCDLARMVTVLGFLLVREPSQVWLLYALTAVQLGFTGFFFPARNAILPSVVAARELGTANALTATTWSVMLALGAALGGLVAGRFGVAAAFLVDAATYAASALLLAAIPGGYRPAAAVDRTVRAAVRQYLEGLLYLWRRREVLFTAAHKALFGFTMGGAMQVVQVVLAQQVFVIGAAGSTSLGLMYAVAGAGTGVGPILVRRFTGDDRSRMRRAIVGAYAMTALGLAVIAPLWSLPVVLAGMFLRGLGGGVNWVLSTQLLMMAVPDEVRGRVFASEFAAFTLAVAASTSLGGWAVDAGTDIGTVVWTMAGLILLPGAAWAWWLRRLEARERAAA